MKRLACYLVDLLKLSVQLTLETIVGAILFTISIAIAATIICFLIKNALE